MDGDSEAVWMLFSVLVLELVNEGGKCEICNELVAGCSLTTNSDKIVVHLAAFC